MNVRQEEKKPLGLTELIDKELQVSMLEAALAADRLGGTLLFFGPDGGGKSSLAFWLAAALNCTVNHGRKGPCGACSSCQKVEGLNHPDVH
ncbi:MAG: DNA polymerase III subunit gamma/tau, partial [Candidatus Glassbacteria bacterium]|nr:DNA polymerase III subunit gamma/tau [Candidatus Glassbacteria bacterium]